MKRFFLFPLLLLLVAWGPGDDLQSLGVKGDAYKVVQYDYESTLSRQGRIVREAFTDSIVYTFNTRGQVVTEEFFSAGSTLPSITRHAYIYDHANSDLVRYRRVSPFDSIASEWKDGKMTMQYVGPNFTLEPSRTFYAYRGHQVYLYDVNPWTGDTIGYRLLTNDSLGRKSMLAGFCRTADPKRASSETTWWKYDSAGNISEEIEDHEGTANDRVTHFTYDSRGNLTVRRIKTAEETILLEYTYEYDSRGSWTKRTMVRSLIDLNGKVTEKKAWEWKERKIIYAE